MSWMFLSDATWHLLLTLWAHSALAGRGGRGLHAVVAHFPCNPGQDWWHKRGLGTDMDLAYWIFFSAHFPVICASG